MPSHEVIAFVNFITLCVLAVLISIHAYKTIQYLRSADDLLKLIRGHQTLAAAQRQEATTVLHKTEDALHQVNKAVTDLAPESKKPWLPGVSEERRDPNRKTEA